MVFIEEMTGFFCLCLLLFKFFSFREEKKTVFEIKFLFFEIKIKFLYIF